MQEIRVLCRFGGEVQFSNKTYVGGSSRLLTISTETSWFELHTKVAERCQLQMNFILRSVVPLDSDSVLLDIIDDASLKFLIELKRSASRIVLYVSLLPTRISNSGNPNFHELPQVNRGCQGESSSSNCRRVNPQSHSAQNKRNVENDSNDPRAYHFPSSEDDDGIGKIECGQKFLTVAGFHQTLREFAAKENFSLTYRRNSFMEVIACCEADECTWRIHAKRDSKESRMFCVESFTKEHTCTRIINSRVQPQPTTVWVVDRIMKRFVNDRNYRPVEIKNDIYRDYGVAITYGKAYQAKKRALEEIYNVEIASYKSLHHYGLAIKETNPGSFYFVEVNDVSNCFEGVFVCFKSCIDGFNKGCLPIICLGRVSLKEYNRGTLLVASSIDPNDEIYPIAYAVVEEEKNMYDYEEDEEEEKVDWHWFLSSLKESLQPIRRKLTFISPKDCDLSVDGFFPDHYHSVCMENFCENLKRAFKQITSCELLWKAARAYTKLECDQALEQIREEDPKLHEWIDRAYNPEQWATAYFPVPRYGHLTTNIRETFQPWIKDLKHRPIVDLLDGIRIKISEIQQGRNENSQSWTSEFVPSAEEKLQINIEKAQHLSASSINESAFKIVDETRSYLAHMTNKNCTCGKWQHAGLPCEHAIAVCSQKRWCIYDFSSIDLSVRTYWKLYSPTMQVIPRPYELKEPPSFSIEEPPSPPSCHPRSWRYYE